MVHKDDGSNEYYLQGREISREKAIETAIIKSNSSLNGQNYL